MNRHERDLVRGMPVRGKRKGAREGEESRQMAGQVCPCEGQREGRRMREEEANAALQFQESLSHEEEFDGESLS